MKIEDGCVIVYKYPNGHLYRVDLKRCDTPVKLLDWVVYLSEKVWMNRRLIRQFVVLVSERHGWDIYNS